MHIFANVHCALDVHGGYNLSISHSRTLKMTSLHGIKPTDPSITLYPHRPPTHQINRLISGVDIPVRHLGVPRRPEPFGSPRSNSVHIYENKRCNLLLVLCMRALSPAYHISCSSLGPLVAIFGISLIFCLLLFVLYI